MRQAGGLRCPVYCLACFVSSFGLVLGWPGQIAAEPAAANWMLDGGSCLVSSVLFFYIENQPARVDPGWAVQNERNTRARSNKKMKGGGAERRRQTNRGEAHLIVLVLVVPHEPM